MKVMKVALFLEGDDQPKTCDAIEHEGKNWLVSRWLENQTLRIAKPERIILLDCLPHTNQIPPGLEGKIDFLLLNPIPKDIFEGRIPQRKTLEFVVIEHPDITLELPGGSVH